MIVQLGEQVIGKNGKLGRIAGFGMDSKSQSAEQMVIKHGILFRSDRLAELGHVTGVETGVVHVDLTRDDLAKLEQYSPSAYHRDVGHPAVNPPFDERGNRPFSDLPAKWTEPGVGTMNDRLHDKHTMPPTYPENEAIVPEDQRLTVISEGTKVIDNQGIKIGEVSDLAVETATGAPTRISLKQGLGGQPEIELPLEWVERYTPEAVVLKVSKDEMSA